MWPPRKYMMDVINFKKQNKILEQYIESTCIYG